MSDWLPLVNILAIVLLAIAQTAATILFRLRDDELIELLSELRQRVAHLEKKRREDLCGK